MATTKTWVGTTGDFQLASNWRPVIITKPAYRWLLSGSGSNEYYLDLIGGGNPNIPEPVTVSANGSALTPGTVGSLAAGAWDYADNDSLGYSTIYVNLSDDTDPDTKASGYVTYNDIPRSGDAIDIPSGSGTITSNLDLSGTTLGKITVSAGQSSAIGSATGYLRLTGTGFEFNGSGVSYIDLAASAIIATVKNPASLPK